ncbi:MAG: MgtC/SapB family protein [Acidimicrobiales bacterium]
MIPALVGPPHANIEGLTQLGELGLAFLLSVVIGTEREIRQKSAGLRTHALVGLGAALFMLISKYGFTDVLIPGRFVVLDPSRVAAQIVTGIGFLGAGLIFVRRDSVRGLTTAAAIWLTAAVGASAGAGLPYLALGSTFLYFVVVLGLPAMVRRLPHSRWAISVLRVRYVDGRGVLRDILGLVTGEGFSLAEVSTEPYVPLPDEHEPAAGPRTAYVEVMLQVFGKGSVNELAASLSDLPGVDAVRASDINSVGE